MRPKTTRLASFYADASPSPVYRKGLVVLYCLGFLLLGILIGLAGAPGMPPTKDAVSLSPVVASDPDGRDGPPVETADASEKPSNAVTAEDPSEAGRAIIAGLPRLVTYSVQEGDTLTSIARKFKTTADSIAFINNLSAPDRIGVGDQLSVLENASGAVERVEEGDTLWDISLRFGISVNRIVEANDILDPNDLVVGQLLILPDAILTPVPQAETASRSSVFSWPLSGVISSSFGWRVHPITNNTRYHEGIDIAAPYGTTVRTAGAGTVTHASWMGGYGRLVIVSHGNGLETRYGHLSGYAVKSGQKVKAGEVIGYVGESGDATGPHCHFEVRSNGQVRNPRDYLP